MEVHKRSRRAVTSRNITIETAVYTDAAYTKIMLVSDFSKRLQHILLKYHAVCTKDINLRIFFGAVGIVNRAIFEFFSKVCLKLLSLNPT